MLPAVGGPAPALAPDLIGMGRSGKPDVPYRFADHTRYLDAWFDRLDLQEVVLIGHDWGGALAFDWAARHPGRTRGVAFFETIVRPMSWSELGDGPRSRAEAMRGPQGEALVLDQNFFLESAFTGGVLNPLNEEKEAYQAPYPTRESRRPILSTAARPATMHRKTSPRPSLWRSPAGPSGTTWAATAGVDCGWTPAARRSGRGRRAGHGFPRVRRRSAPRHRRCISSRTSRAEVS